MTPPTINVPAVPSGTGTVAPGTPAARWATPPTHHNSGPVKRISSRAPAGQIGHSAAAAVPSTVIGAITAATSRFAAAATTLNRPEMAATKGAVTSCAAQATATASANGLGQPRSANRRDQAGARTTSAAVASTDSANPTSTDSCGATANNTSTVAARAGIACRRREVSMPANAMAPITAARNTLAVGCTTTTKATSASAASRTAARGPISRAENSTAAHTIVTLAPDTAIRCVMPAARKSRPVGVGTAEVSPSTSAGSSAAWSAGSVSRTAAAKRRRTSCAARCTALALPRVGRPDAVSTATVRSRRVGRPIRAVNRTGWPTISPPKSGPRAKTTTRPDIWSERSCCKVARNISRPWFPEPNDTGLSEGVTVTGALAPKSAAIGW
ncbi:hypothetical protein PICSAR132_02426 [Mycobacterium avium subsp. paratuberculosis]|nr:hypothetical protein B0173_01295 [Mycobacterium avium subsp. paratuberculosis]QKU45065.1 hypothetical protein MAP44135_1652 [Mycobacterium avium subsp. paratuberculosis]CAG6857444.1 hypothetical protein PICSAR118_00498 [Mycobacterium avium subsp. paratuberculosis]CAG6881404.1 hypothetical protein PICSAR117_01697 [Mycobacterium avium subsp. paratuberculosis]CAG6889882.1 hypothetical protein PICSAR124B_02164 [Mycobacterium avium subsp. paratuberculosis]